MQQYNGKVDMRVYRSKRDLANALESLLREKNYDDILISEIVARAMVSKNTFYNNFLDKNDLLNFLFQRYADELLKNIEPFEEDKKPREENLKEIIKVMVHFFYESPIQTKKMITNDKTKSLYWNINSFVQSFIYYGFKNRKVSIIDININVNLDLLCPFLAGGVTNLLYYLCDNNIELDENELVNDIITLITR